jgi:DNA-binding GntR family transcriptional regulator
LELETLEPVLARVARHESLAEKAYLALRQALMRGRLVPGQRLVHRTIAGELGVSATPVREALLRLASEGAVALDARGIAYVPRLSPQRYDEILQLRIDLEGRSAARAAVLARPEEIEQLAALHDAVARSKAAGDIEGVLCANERFHFALHRSAQLPVTERLIESLWIQCGPTLRLRYLVQESEAANQHPHLAVINALRQRDPLAARAALSRDLRVNGAVILRQIRAEAARDLKV